MTTVRSIPAQHLSQTGHQTDGIASFRAELRASPTDVAKRTFLFELLCFAGAYDRAERQLDVLSDGGREAEMGVLLYRSALYAERRRSAMFDTGETPSTGQASSQVAGSINGRPFSSLSDADPRIGARLELFVAGQYMWLPLEHIVSLTAEPPRRLRDLLWAPVRVTPAPHLSGLQLGEVHLPVLTPLAWRSRDDLVRHGRVSDWNQLPSGEDVPVGQKMLLVDEEPMPILEIRDLRIEVPAVAPIGADAGQ
jgi:type VI secretion system protein ImpE